MAGRTRHTDLEKPLAYLPADYEVPYPPNLTDLVLRRDFADDFLEYIRAIDLRDQFVLAATSITLSDDELVYQATGSEIQSAIYKTVSMLAKQVWTRHYWYDLDGPELPANGDFHTWLQGRAAGMRRVMLDYSEDAEWREELRSLTEDGWLSFQ